MKAGKTNWKLLIHTALCMLLMAALVLGYQGYIAMTEATSTMAGRIRMIPDDLTAQDELIARGTNDIQNYDRNMVDEAVYLIQEEEAEGHVADIAAQISEVTDLDSLTLFQADGSIEETTLRDHETEKANRVRELFGQFSEAGTDGETEDPDLSLIWYGRTLGDGRIVIASVDSSNIAVYRRKVEEANRLLQRMMEGLPGSVFIIRGDGIESWPERDWSAEENLRLENDLRSLSTPMSGASEPDIQTGIRHIAGELSLTAFYSPKDVHYSLAIVLPLREIARKLGMALAIILLTLSVLIVWIRYCRTVIHLDPGENTETRELHRKALGQTRPGLYIVALLLLIISLFSQTLSVLDSFSMQAEDDVAWMRTNLEALLKRHTQVEKEFTRRLTEKTAFAGTALSQGQNHLQHLTAEDLAGLSRTIGADYLLVFDESGKEMLSDSNWEGLSMTDRVVSGLFEPLRPALKGGGPYRTELAKDPLNDADRYFASAPLCNENNRVIGCVVAAFSPSAFLKGIIPNGLAFIMNQTVDQALVYNPETKEVSYAQLPDKAEPNPESMGVSQEQIDSSYDNLTTLRGQAVYLSIFTWNDQTVITLQNASLNGLILHRVLMMCLLLLLAVTIYYPRMFRLVLREKVSEEARLPDRDRKAEEENSNRQSGLELFMMAFAAAICVLTVLTGIQGEVIADSLSDRLIHRQWAYSFNIYSMTYVVMITCLIYALTRVLRQVLLNMASHLSLRGETICKLIGSMLTYLGLIAVLFYDLSLLGVSSPTLLTSAGILSLVVGMGANSLIADVVAGLFIIFEGNVQVGDTIEMGGWTGVVQSIGIRTTTFLTPTQDIKIINNARILDLTNKSRGFSSVTMDLLMPGDLPLPEAEAAMEEMCKEVTKRCKRIHGRIRLDGLAEARPDGYLMRIIFECPEKIREKLTMKVRREFYLIMHPEKAANEPKEEDPADQK